MRQIWRFLLVLGGTICVVLGGIGVFLPLLPTTPFLLLAVALYSRGSPRLHNWLLGNRWFGEYLRRYREHRSMTRRHKAFTLIMLWAVIGSSATLWVTDWWLRLLLGIVAIGVTRHLLRIPSD
jgi:uncharacterized protein